MRWPLLVVVSLAAGQVQARPPRPHDDPGASALWRDVIEPHGVEVAALLTRARTAMTKLADSSDVGPARRMRFAGEAYGLLRHAHKLSPDNPEVLNLLGHAADELGKTREAIEALEACVRLQGPERAGSDVTGRLGTIYLRLGKLDDAVRWLRGAQGSVAITDNAIAAVHLATALAGRGEMADAIDVLANALPAQSNYFNDPIALVSLSLAVHYDRDEQRSAAFEVLDRMQATLQQELGQFSQRALAAMQFAPAEDEYYYRGLLYETLGDYPEARAEWALYAAVTDAPWRRRALEHIAAIDAQRTAPPQLPPGPRRRFPIHHKAPVP